MVQDKKLICLFGGEKQIWIDNFIATAKKCWGEEVKMVYIYNKSINEAKRIEEIKTSCDQKGVTCWDKHTTSTYFWNRIESVFSSRTKITTNLKEAASMIALGSQESGWGLIGSTEGPSKIRIAKAKGDIMEKALGDPSKWKDRVAKVGYAAALHEHLVKIHVKHVCKEFSYGYESHSEVKVCSECAWVMERTYEYRCLVNTVQVETVEETVEEKATVETAVGYTEDNEVKETGVMKKETGEAKEDETENGEVQGEETDNGEVQGEETDNGEA